MPKVSIDSLGTELRELYPSNSKFSKPAQPEPEEKKPLEKVVTGEVKMQKKPLGEKIKSIFVMTDFKDIRDYAWYDLIIPGLKAGMLALFEMSLYGSVKYKTGRSSFGGIDYSRISGSGFADRTRGRNSSDRNHPRERNVLDLKDIVLQSRAEGAAVILQLKERITECGAASVGDLYDLLGEKCDFTAESFGWKDLSAANIRAVRGGFLLELPRPIYLN